MNLSSKQAADIVRRIKLSLRHARQTYHDDYDSAAKLYRGEHYADMARQRDYERIVVNYLYALVETKVAAQHFAYPEFTLKPGRAADRPQAETAKAALTWIWRTGRAQEEAKRCLRDKEIGGLGIMTTGWLVVTGDANNKPALPTLFEGARPPVEGEAPDPTPNLLPGEPPGPVATGPLREDRPYQRRLPPKDFWVAPETNAELADALWCGYTERLPLDVVKKHPRYEGTRDLQGTAENFTDLSEELRDKKEEAPTDLRRVALHHYYEKARRLHLVWTEEREKPLLVEAWPHPYDRYPFNVLRSPDDEDRFYPRPPLLLVEHPQRELNQARTLLAVHQRQSNRKLQFAGRLTDANIRQLRSSHVLGIVQLEGPNLITEVPHAPIQPEIFKTEEAARADIQFLAALSEYEAFSPPTKRTTTAEAQLIAGAGGARATAARTDYEHFLANVAKDTLALMQQYSVATRSFGIFSRDGSVVDFGDYTRAEIAGDFILEVYVGSTTAPNRQTVMDQLAFFMQSLPALVQGIQAGDAIGMNFRPLVAQMFSALPEIRDVEAILTPNPAGPPGMPQGMLGPGMGQAPQNALPGMNGGQPGADPQTLVALLAALGGPAAPPGGGLPRPERT